jgi:HTH-type transcriptional regulator / antitoxin HipB
MSLESNADNVATIIRRHRKAAKLTQHELADLAGVGKTVVFEIEHGKTSVQLDTLLKILHILNIKLTLKGPL